MKVYSIISILILSIFTNFNNIATVNSIKDDAYDAYFKNDYEKSYYSLVHLTDSLELNDPGITLNKAHSLYFLGGLGTLMAGLNQKPDSIREQLINSSKTNYQLLWTEPNSLISSIAYNQSGIISFKTRKTEEVVDLNAAVDMFKEAVRKNPNNEEARYNYEMLKRFVDYPEEIMKKVRLLVKERDYITAYNLLAEKVTNDPRFSKNQEYLKRLSDIVKIETQTQ